jgi:hypothetical protein
MPRLRPTFLLRCVVLAGCVALVLGVLAIGLGTGWTAATLVLTAAIWLVGIEGELLPMAIEHIVIRRARRSGKSTSSIWFVDLDQERSRQMDGFHDDSRNNPTLR